MSSNVRLQMMAGGKGLSTTILFTSERLLSGMSSGMFPQITQSSEELDTVDGITIESVTTV
jgi:hypothetical protein